MKSTNYLSFLLLGLFLLSLQSCYLAHGLKIRKLSKQSSLQNINITDTIPFSYENGWITVDVKVAGVSDKKKFILDTHAGTSLFESSFPDHQYKKLMSAKAKDFNGQSFDMEVVEIENLQVGNLVFEKVVGSVSRGPRTCADIDGILGYDLMRLANWQIDFENQIIIVSDSASNLKYANDAMIIPMQTVDASGVFSIKVSDGDDGYEYISVDLGAATNLFILPGYLKRLRENGLVTHAISVSGKSGASLANKERDKEITFGSINKLKFIDTEYELDSVYFNSTPGLLTVFGCSFFSNFRTTIDYENKQLILELYKKKYSVTNLQNRGFYLERRDDKLYLGKVYENSPASSAHLETGQRLISVNGVNVESADYRKFCEVNSALGETIRLTVVESDGSHRDVTIETEPMSKMIYH